MGKIKRQLTAELKQLPWMLGKLAGGILAVIGFAKAVITGTRTVGATFVDTLTAILAGCAGVIIFLIFSRSLARRLSGNGPLPPASGDGLRTSRLSWAILIVLAVLFLVRAYFITR